VETYRTWQEFLQAEWAKELEEMKRQREIESKIFEEIKKTYRPNQPITSTLTITKEEKR